MKSIRTNPTNGAPQGDERIRTAVTSPGTDPAYENPDSVRDPIHQAQSRVRSFIYSTWGTAGEQRVRPALDALDELERIARGAVS